MSATTTSEHRWAVVDVETSGTDPDRDRIISIAALTLAPDGTVERTLSTLLNPGIANTGPADIHGITADMLTGQPSFGAIVGKLSHLLGGRTLVAHNAAFDYAFLAAEAKRANTALPVETVMCTVALARRLNLPTENVKLASLARYWGVAQARPHDAADDALVLTEVLRHALTYARRHDIALPLCSPHSLRPPVFNSTHRAA